EHEPASLRVRADSHGGRWWRVLQGIADDVFQDVLEATGIRVSWRQVRRELERDAAPAFGHADVRAQTLQEWAHCDRHALKKRRMRLELRDVQDVVDDLAQAFGQFVDPFDGMASVGRR